MRKGGHESVLGAPLFHFVALVAGILVLSVTLSCGSDRESVGDVSSPPEADVASAASERAPDLPDRGEIAAHPTAGGVTVLANAASRLQVVRTLAELGGFELELGDTGEDRLVTLELVDVPVELALARSLEELNYSFGYGVDPETGVHRLLRVRVGSGDARPARSRPEQVGGRRERMPLSPAQIEEARLAQEERRREREKIQDEVRIDLGAGDPAIRIAALENVLIDEGGNLERVADLLSNDPSPEVRARAAQKVFESDEEASLGYLLGALDDPDPAVVMETLDLLEFVGDESVVPYVLPLRNHPNPEVAVMADEVVDFLSW